MWYFSHISVENKIKYRQKRSEVILHSKRKNVFFIIQYYFCRWKYPLSECVKGIVRHFIEWLSLEQSITCENTWNIIKDQLYFDLFSFNNNKIGGEKVRSKNYQIYEFKIMVKTKMSWNRCKSSKRANDSSAMEKWLPWICQIFHEPLHISVPPLELDEIWFSLDTTKEKHEDQNDFFQK